MKKRLLPIVLAMVLICCTITITSAEDKQLRISYLDVGQGDSILIQLPDGENVLIDAGDVGKDKIVCSYLDSQKIKTIDVLVCTHPHADHEGSLDKVILKYTVKKLYMPTDCKNTKGKRIDPTSAAHKRVLSAIKKKNLKPTTLPAGTVLKMGDSTFTVLAPNKTAYNDLNNFSLALKLTYQKESFLFMGDAEAQSEGEILAAQKVDVKADVIKVGHHGSDSSTSDAFLKAVAPKYAVISAGKKNRYQHPYKVTMNKLQNAKIPVYRTDECGTIVCTSDGQTISFNTNPGDYTPGGNK